MNSLASIRVNEDFPEPMLPATETKYFLFGFTIFVVKLPDVVFKVPDAVLILPDAVPILPDAVLILYKKNR